VVEVFRATLISRPAFHNAPTARNALYRTIVLDQYPILALQPDAKGWRARMRRGQPPMTDRERPDPWTTAESLIVEARDARVRAHVRALLSRLQSRAPKPSREAA
jgi:hypothetical protein